MGIALQYQGIQHDILLYVKRLGLFDVSHMGLIEITGHRHFEISRFFIDAPLLSKGEGSVTYTVFCNELGFAVDDLLVYLHKNRGLSFSMLLIEKKL